jgi:hypothetical protein
MIFEFIVTYRPLEDAPIHDVLCERLNEAMEANLNDVDEEVLSRMVQTSFERLQPDADDGTRLAVLGFSLELPSETSSIREVVDDFADALMAEPILHAVKYEDPLLRIELAARGEELFALEMKLRRVLSIIYLHAYPSADAYDLLAEETVQPMAKDRPQKEQMKIAVENQFFHLTFSQYVGLNQRPAIKDLASLIRNQASYEVFRTELLRQPVEHEDDASFLAGLKERVDAVEKMRNAVAHNRRPSKKVSNDYLNALPLLNQALDDYLDALAADWRDRDGSGETPWDRAARDAVDRALNSAHWDEGAGAITLHAPDESRMEATIVDRAGLVSYLEAAAASAFYANCPREDGEFLHQCDQNGVVESVLSYYEDRLSEFFTRK